MQAQYEISAGCFRMGNKDGGKFVRRFYKELSATGSQGDWTEQHELSGESSSCADLHVGVHLRAAQSFQREVKPTLDVTVVASATARDCS